MYICLATNYPLNKDTGCVKAEKCSNALHCLTAEQSLSPSSGLVGNCISERLPSFLPPAESLQAVRAGVPGHVQREEDALHYPAQTFSQWAQEGTQCISKPPYIVSATARKFCPVLKSCSAPQVVTPVVWNKPDVENSVPLWIIILAILAGLLLLALLIYVLYKVSDPLGSMIRR